MEQPNQIQNDFSPEITLQYLLEVLKSFDSYIEESILNIYQFGSRLNFILKYFKILKAFFFSYRVYGTAHQNSDWDFFVIFDPEKASKSPFLLEPPLFNHAAKEFFFPKCDKGVINATLVPLPLFKIMLKEHRHEALECFFAPPSSVISFFFF